MKFISSEISYLLTIGEHRRDLKTFFKFLLFLLGVISLYSVGFHLLMLREGQEFSWLTGFYWTLTVMSTLGFGDITFHTDLGRAFTIVVLLSGIVLLLIVLPFAFIRFFYAPWLESQLRHQAPRKVSDSMSGHVIICAYDEVARGLIDRLEPMHVPYVVIESDAAKAAGLHQEGISVISGEVDARETYEAIGFGRARLLVANLDDISNTNITITAREVAGSTTIVATALDADATDVLQLAGADHVIALRHRLGEHLASRVSVRNIHVHVVGRYKGVAIAEFPVRHTTLAGKTLRTAELRSRTGVTVAAVARRGRLHPGLPDTVLEEDSIGVVVGKEEQLEALNDVLTVDVATDPVLIIGGGKVGRSAARALKARDIPVHVIEKEAGLRTRLESLADRVFIGDASDLDVVVTAGLKTAPSVILTTRDDAINIFLAVYCRKLHPDTIIVSRITLMRNIEAIHRAGADFAVSDPMMGIQTILSILEGRDLTLLGEGLDFFGIEVPPALVGKSLVDAGIRALTGLNIVAIERSADILDGLTPGYRMNAGERLLVLGTADQRETFERLFG